MLGHRPVGRRAGARRRGRRGPAAPTQLERLSLEVVTLNGFPYQAFHAPVVKRDVYWPHWAQDDAARLHARSRAAAGEAAPRGRRGGLDLHAAARVARGLGRRGAGRGAARARRSRRSSSRRSQRATGKRIRLALEPEPGCTVETIAQACDALARARAGLDRRLPRRLPSRGAVRGPGRRRSRCSPRSRRADRQDPGLVGAARARRRARRRVASCSRASTSRGSCTRCASA